MGMGMGKGIAYTSVTTPVVGRWVTLCLLSHAHTHSLSLSLSLSLTTFYTYIHTIFRRRTAYR